MSNNGSDKLKLCYEDKIHKRIRFYIKMIFRPKAILGRGLYWTYGQFWTY